ncbi:MAG: dimethyl sulfoxide reductase anchor subunit [Alphaproteobacteria bacterium]|nr:dimethyl sulfoxide reductase anchor subunit [Alphaproteobacteria bacterium]
MTSDLREIKGVSPWLQTNWDARAAGNFIGGGTGTGLLAVAAFLGLTPIGLFSILGLAFVGLGLLCVWLEIGRPWRAINVFFHPQTSWMTREGLVAMPLFGLGGLAFLFDSTLALMAAALVGLFYLYCQARIISASKGIPAWRHPALIPALLAMGLAEGAGVAMLFAPGQGAFLALVLIGLRYALWQLYLNRLEADGAPAGTIKAFAVSRKLFLIAGHMLPLLLIGAAEFSESPLLAMGGGLLVVASGWWMKLILITKAAYNQGFAVPRVPVRGQGKPGAPVKPGWV